MTTSASASADENKSTQSRKSGGNSSRGGQEVVIDNGLSEGGGGGGNVASRPRSRQTRVEQQYGTPSSWAFDRATASSTTNRSRRRNIILPRGAAPGEDMQSHKSAPPPRTETPTTNNRTAGAPTNSYYTPVKAFDGGGGTNASSKKIRRSSSRRTAAGGGGPSSSGIKSDTSKAYSLDDMSLPAVGTAGDSSQQQQQQGHRASRSSFKGWLTAGILDVLNVAAGLTLSTTGTIMAPPIALARNVLIPSVLALFIDTLDNVTPSRVQDWVRIVTSSVYHFYSVLSGTERGKVFRKQLLLVIKVVLEAWSAPEARQVVVDGMATGVKLADALHTPEMLLFLEQSSVLGCRIVDALASGTSKQVIQNSKDLIWKGIELAVDPSTTAALAEVTAHLCQALEEMDNDLNPPPTARTLRNTQNYTTYLQPLQMTEYQGESIEDVILSSLGVHDDTTANTDTSYGNYSDDEDDDDVGGGDDDGDDEGIAVASVPSNVAFHHEATRNSRDVGQQIGTLDTSWKDGERRVNVELLKDRIAHRGRSQARPKKMATAMDAAFETHSGISGNPRNVSTSEAVSSKVSVPVSTTDEGNDDADQVDDVASVEDVSTSFPFLSLLAKDIEEDAPEINGMKIGSANTVAIQNQPDVDEVYDRFEHMRQLEEEEPAAVQFYQVIDDLLQQRRIDRIEEHETLLECPRDPAARSEWKRSHAKIRKIRDGKVTTTSKTSGRVFKEEYSNLRRLWKYPPWVLQVSTIILGTTGLFWLVFGLYGMYTFANVVYLHRSSGNSIINLFAVPTLSGAAAHNRFTTPQSNPNEIVIRIVKEVVHVGVSGNECEGNISFDVDEASPTFSREEQEKVIDCIASSQN